MNIGERIQALRKARGLSQEELAAQIGVSRQAVSKWEAGQSQPDLDKVLVLSDFFGVTTDYLLRSQPSTPSDIQPQASTPRKSSIRPMGFFGIGTAINLIAVITYAILELYYHSPLCLIPAVVGCIAGTATSLVGISAAKAGVSPSEHTRAINAFGGVNAWLLLFPIAFPLCWKYDHWYDVGYAYKFLILPFAIYCLFALGISAYFIFFRTSKE